MEKDNKKNKEPNNGKNTISDFVPLIVALGIVILTTVLFVVSEANYDPSYIIRIYMSTFFIVFSLAKLADLKSFIEAFKQYDLLAIKYPNYAIFYPLGELFLGVMYANNNLPFATNLITLVVMTIGAKSILDKQKKIGKHECSCLGTLFNVPLTDITLIENISMALLAAYNLYIILL